MTNKKPDRWLDTIIDTPHATLTKKQVFDYYTNPLVKNEIMKAVGNREVVVRQSFEPGKDILRRKDSVGDLIKFETPKQFKDLVGKRLSEIHPTFGRHTNTLLADIDPQKNVPWEKTKSIAETVAKTMKMHPDVKKVEVQFSGGRGFYVKGIMDKAIKIDAARALTQKVLHGIAQRPDVTFGVTRNPSQIRIDTTPLKFRGSVRAPMSLNASTGLVAAPVTLAKLPKVEKSDFTIQKIIKRAAARSSIPDSILEEALKDKYLGSGMGAGDIRDMLSGTYPDPVTEIRDKADTVGFLASKKSPWIPNAIVGNMFVSKKSRGKGLGTAALKEFAAAHPDALSGIDVGNLVSKRVHEKAGFEPTGEKWKRSGNEQWRVKKASKMDVLDEANNIGDQGVRVRHEGDADSDLIDSAGPDAVKKRAERLAERMKTGFDLSELASMAAPLDDALLPAFRRYMKKKENLPAGEALVQRVKHAATGPGKGEFAPGIPKARITHPIPEIKNKAWTLAIQQHDAFKAGPHWDVRLVDPETARAHSFAVPKMKFPEGTETILGIRQPTHKRRYALKFEGDIPRGVYGGGSVKMHLQEPINVIKANANRISFERPNGDKLVMFQMRDKHWGMKKLT